MPRLPRLHAPGAIYHVTVRGNHRQNIFFKRSDRQLLDEFMARATERTGARVHAYCWMTNHLHLLVQVGDQPLGALMQRVGTRFSRYIQKGIPTTGHLFENRYHALLVDVDNYFLELVRYIHLNPVRARIVDTPEQYLWSSHRAYLGKTEQPWVHTHFALSLFSHDIESARSAYAAFVNERVSDSHQLEIRGHQKEPRVFGDDRFLETLAIPSLHRRATKTLEQIAHDVSNEFSITTDALRSPSRNRSLSKARAIFAHRARSQHFYSLSDIARYLNRSASALARGMESYSCEVSSYQTAILQT